MLVDLEEDGVGQLQCGFAVVHQAQGRAEHVGLEALDELLERADYVSLHTPLTPETRHLINDRTLALMKPTAVLVNTARGGLVDESALLQALLAGRLAGAALDVTATEPLPPESPLWDAPSLVLTPHAAGGRPVGADELIAHNVAALLSGGELRNVVHR